MILAVDIGASATKAALWRPKRYDPAALDIDGQFQWSTTLFLDRGRGMLTGVAPENLAGAPRYRGRYLVGVKQQVNKPDPATEPLYRELRFPTGGTEPLVRGIGVILAHALTAVPKRFGRPDRLVLSHPVVWTDTEKAVLVEAAAAALPGVPVALVSEAEAVGLHMASRLPAGGSYAVLDFGASSFDFAVLRHQAQGPARVVYDGGRLIGGDDFDACLLNLVRESADAGQLRELTDIATTEPELLRAEAEQVKKALSDGDEAVFAVRGLEIDVYRAEFEAAIAPLVQTCRTLVDEALSLLHADPPHTFALSGGAARIPLVREQMADLAAGAGAEVIDAQEETPGSLVALGALRIPADAPAPRARAVRPFTLAAEVMKAPAARTPLTAVRGGLAFLGPDAGLQVWQDDGTGTMGPVALRRKVPGSVAMTAGGTGRELVLASPSPAFTVMELNARGEDVAASVFGHLAATPSRSEGRVTALAHWWPLLAWCVDDGPGGSLVDVRADRWSPLLFDEPVSELTFAGPGMLLARTATGLFLLDTDSLRTPDSLRRPAFLPLSEPFSVAVEPSSATAAVSGAGAVSGYALRPDGFERLWHRPLGDGGPVACTAPGGQPVVIVFDTHDGVYRALAADTGRQLALRDAAASTGPHRMYPSPDPGVVYARTPGFVHRLRLEGPVR
ncbi:Hsp70 family protein [Streptomyces sp. IBSNAI002]|uniref:Hsp70 family protein n=1 Tax=Streptomyces sp. IBSNAI002 TaxID=3457500 RepID=UPI003FD53886